MLCSKRTTKMSGVEWKVLHKELYIQNKNTLSASPLGGSSPLQQLWCQSCWHVDLTAGYKEYSQKSPGPSILFTTSKVREQLTSINDWILFKILLKEGAAFGGGDD